MLCKAYHTQGINLKVQLVDKQTWERVRIAELGIDGNGQVSDAQIADLPLQSSLAVVVPPKASTDAMSGNVSKTLPISDLVYGKPKI